MIRNLNDLAMVVEANHDRSTGATDTEIEKSVARRLYKDTTCGISFWTDGTEIVLCGYCEGTDWDLPGHVLTYPFTEAELWAAVAAADKDGCDAWDESHGCDSCGTENEYGVIPINPGCPSCKGEGVIL